MVADTVNTFKIVYGNNVYLIRNVLPTIFLSFSFDELRNTLYNMVI